MDLLPQPPWVYCPKEVNEWLFSTASPVRTKKLILKKKQKTVENVELSIDLDVEKIELTPSNWLRNFVSQRLDIIKVEEHFNPIIIAEKILKSLDSSKFKNIIEIKMDEKILYYHPEMKKDVTQGVKLLAEQLILKKRCTSIEIIVRKESIHECTAKIRIKKIHAKKIHAIDILLNGKLREKTFHRFLNQLKHSLPIKEMNIKV